MICSVRADKLVPLMLNVLDKFGSKKYICEEYVVMSEGLGECNNFIML